MEEPRAAEDIDLISAMIEFDGDEDLDNLHSLYVDQWDWEKTIRRNDATWIT